MTSGSRDSERQECCDHAGRDEYGCHDCYNTGHAHDPALPCPPAAPPPVEGETERARLLAAAELLRPQVDRDRKTAYWQDRQGQLDGIASWLDSLIDWARP